MKQFTYSYEVLNVNEEAKVMEVQYVCDGYKTHIVGVPLPFANELISEVIHQYAPVASWDEESIPRGSVSVGLSGEKTVEVASRVYDENPALSDAERFEVKRDLMLSELGVTKNRKIQEGDVMVDGMIFSTSKETLSDLKSALDIIKDNIREGTVAWKFRAGVYRDIGETTISSAIVAVSEYIQSMYEWERAIADSINAATKIEDLDSIDVYDGLQ